MDRRCESKRPSGLKTPHVCYLFSFVSESLARSASRHPVSFVPHRTYHAFSKTRMARSKISFDPVERIPDPNLVSSEKKSSGFPRRSEINPPASFKIRTPEAYSQILPSLATEIFLAPSAIIQSLRPELP